MKTCILALAFVLAGGVYAQVNPCIICPNGATEGYDDVVPWTTDNRTCAELIDDAKAFESGSGDCAWAETYEIACCFTEPENPCIICPNGANEGLDDYVPPGYNPSSTCAELIDFAMQFETESDVCGGYGEYDKLFCCPPETPAEETTDASTSGTTAMNPCIICPNGTTEGYDDVAPYAGDGDPRTCVMYIEEAKLFETGSKQCAVVESYAISCCTEPENPCIICPDGVTEGLEEYVPPYEMNTYTCAELIDYDALFETESDYCRVYGEENKSYCCPPETPAEETTDASTSGTTAMNPCIICPSGVTAGYEDVVPLADSGDNRTCAEIIDSVKLLETGSEDCVWAETYELGCCFTVPENPCIICPDGVTEGLEEYVPEYEGNTFTCAEDIAYFKQFETESDVCGLISELDESYCCPPETPAEETTDASTSGTTAMNPCIICPNGVTAGYDDAAPYATFGNNMTCAQAIDAAKLYETGSRDCASSEAYEIACCFTVPENPAMNPCIICPDGITEGYDAYAPWAVIGDPTTCAELIDAAMQFETGSENCALAEGNAYECCVTEIENPCIICPNGATVGDDYVPPGYEGTELTCADLIGVAAMYETESSYCAVYGEEDESLCCPPVSSCIICPDGITEGYDAYAPWAFIGDPTTCAELIDAAKLYEAGSEDCALAEMDQSECCLTEIENPCIICPNGATVGDDYVPPGYEDSELTCADLIGVAAMYETESSYCAVLGEEDESLCCPPVTSAPTPMPVNDTTVATTTTSSTNNNNAPTPVSTEETMPPSSNVGTTTLLWVRVISAVVGVCLMGALAVFFLRKRTAQVQVVQGPAITSPAGVDQQMPEGGIPTAVASKIDPETADTPFFQLNQVPPPAYSPDASAPPQE